MKALSPAFRQAFDFDSAFEQLEVRRRGSVEMVELGDGQTGGLASEKLKFVSGGGFSLLDYRKIEATESAAQESLDHILALEFGCQFEARETGSCDSDQGRANAILVSHANAGLKQALGREVLSESAPWQFFFWKLMAPVAVVLGRINVDGFVHAAMHREIGLTVAVEVRFPEHDPAVYWLLENTGFERGTLPGEKAGQPDVHGYESHFYLSDDADGLSDADFQRTANNSCRFACHALPIAVTSYKIESLLTAVGSRKQVPPGLESNQYAIQESI